MTIETPHGQAPAPKTPLKDFWQSKPMIVNFLYLASFMLALTGIGGVVVAYVWRNEVIDTANPAEAWMVSHLDYQIRTFWIGLVAMMIGFVLMFILIGIFLLIAVAVWVIVRSVMSIQRCQYAEPMPDPMTLLW